MVKTQEIQTNMVLTITDNRGIPVETQAVVLKYSAPFSLLLALDNY